VSQATTPIDFTLPDELAAAEPPEARGLPRDEVRLLVARTEGLRHFRFRDLGGLLRPGDLVVVNNSATLAAAVDGERAGGSPVVVHFSAPLEDGSWIAELRSPDGSGPMTDAAAGEVVDLRAGGERLKLASAHPDAAVETGSRLWRVRVTLDGPVEDYLAEYGRPITYGYVRGRWPLESYQTVFARHPGSAEMPSAGRPFTHRLVTHMVADGVTFAPLLLHTGVSSFEAGERPPAERFRVPAPTAALVNLTRRNGGLVVAVGTTVARALESAARPDGTVVPAEGWTNLVLGPERPARVVDALITGWHAPRASHLLLLEAVAGRPLVERAYDAALASRYLWHEFGDSCLFVAPRRALPLAGDRGASFTTSGRRAA
jgi:S-adenosylmethionine:tRNA ribosyltransferase-isomerase